MAVFSGTNIVNDGLVFHFDLQNSVKSWKGKPTTNLISQSGIDFTAFSGYPSLSVERVTEPESPSNYALKMKIAQLPINNSSRSRFGNADNIPTSGQAYVSVKVKKEGTGDIKPAIYTGQSWNFLSPLDDDNIYLTEEYRRFGRYVTFGTNSGGPNPGFSMTYGWPSGSQNIETLTYWHSPQVETSTISTRFVNGVRLDTATIIDVSPTKSTITAGNLTYRQDDTPTFDGTDDYISVTDISGDLSEQTISLWCKNSGTGGIYSSYNNDLNRVRISDNGSNIGLYTGHGAIGAVSFSASKTSGEWVYAVITLDFTNDVYKIYINGELGNSSTATTSAPNNYGEMNIGCLKDTDFIASTGIPYYSFYQGEIDQVKVYDRVLTDAEIKQNFEATRSRYGI